MSNPITRWIQRQAKPLIEDAYRKGSEAGFLEAWQAHDVFDTGTADTLPLDGHDTRRAYERLPLFRAALDTVTSLTLGTGVTYGELDDPRAMQALEEWYALNDIENLSKQMFLQWMLDGELLLLIAQDASPSEPAWLNLWDTKERPVEIRTAPGNPRLITGVKVGTQTTREPNTFVWRASGTLFNKTRGQSPIATAVPAAAEYTRLLELRMRAHEIRGRLNAVYYALAEDAATLNAKAERYRKLPRDGNVITLQMNAQGQSERLEFTNPDTRAADAETDVRALIRTVAMVTGVPEHYLSVGDTGNRATAESMAEPMLRRIEEHQTFLEGVLTAAFQRELVRRYGPASTFTVRTSELQRDGTRVDSTMQVPARDLHIPFSFPPVRGDDQAELDRVRFAYEAGLLSRESTIEALGFDPALELERQANDPAADPPGGDASEPDPE